MLVRSAGEGRHETAPSPERTAKSPVDGEIKSSDTPNGVLTQAALAEAFAGDWSFVVRTAGLEPTTSCSGGKRSIRLSYARTR